MSSHPDADAFLRAILTDPAEVTTRLAFADWLEETGDPANVDWGNYIRLMSEADTHPDDSFERANCLWRAANLPVGVGATLELPAAFFVAYHHLLLRLLPAERFRVALGEFTIPPEAREVVSELLVRFHRIVPLAVQDRLLLVAVPDPDTWDTLWTLRVALGRELLAVGAAADELVEAINRHYHQTAVGDVVSMVVEFTDTVIELPEPTARALSSFRLDLGPAT